MSSNGAFWPVGNLIQIHNLPADHKPTNVRPRVSNPVAAHQLPVRRLDNPVFALASRKGKWKRERERERERGGVRLVMLLFLCPSVAEHDGPVPCLRHATNQQGTWARAVCCDPQFLQDYKQLQPYQKQLWDVINTVIGKQRLCSRCLAFRHQQKLSLLLVPRTSTTQ